MNRNILLRISCLMSLTAVLAGCPVRGTDEAAEFQIIPNYSSVSFDLLKSKILVPFKCIECHAGMNQETGLRDYVVPGQARSSKLWNVLEQGQMPKNGPKLSESYCQLVETYIDGLAPFQPTPTPMPLAPTFVSLEANLFVVSCKGCHGGPGEPNPKKRINLFDYETVKKNAQKIDEYISTTDDDDSLMPPLKANRKKPTPEIILTLEKWIKLGFPKE